jgi:hypothetical protein
MLPLAERARRVRLLLETLNDPYPAPRGALRSDSGPAASRYVPCETCRARGDVRAKGGWIMCLVCDGAGWKRRESEPPWDAYIGLPLEVANELPRALSPARLEPDGESDAYPGQSKREVYDRAGSYSAVRANLDWLSLTDRYRYLLVRRILVDHEPYLVDRATGMHLEIGVVSIARRMPRVRVPWWLMERLEGVGRRATIAELAAQGLTAGQIARHLGVSKKAVGRKVKRDGVVLQGAGVAFAVT